jgi:hypothetical protein
MERITYSLLNKTLTAPDVIVCNADNDTIELAIDSTGTIYETWEKRCDLAMPDGTTDILGFSVVNTDVIAVFTLTSAHLKKGALVINPYVQDNGARKGFPKKSVQVVSQLGNDVVNATVQVLINDYIDARIDVKEVITETLESDQEAAAGVNAESDGLTFIFGIPRGLQGVPGNDGADSDVSMVYLNANHYKKNQMDDKFDESVKYIGYEFGFDDPKPLMLNDWSGYNQPFHPSVLYLPQRFANHKYWLVQTPYPIGGLPYRDRWECPVVYKSNDGVEWETVIDPLDDLTSDEVTSLDYMSDPHMVYRQDLDRLEIWYRFTHNRQDGSKYTDIHRKTTTDGFTWSDRETMIAEVEIGDPLFWISHSILWDDVNSKYRVWYYDNTKIVYSESSDGLTWDSPTNVTKDVAHNTWHLDVNYFDNLYHLLSYSTETPNTIVYYTSENGTDFTKVSQLLSTGDGVSLYSQRLYRACSLKDEFGKVRVYTTAESTLYQASILMLVGNDFSDLEIVNNTVIDNKKLKTYDETETVMDFSVNELVEETNEFDLDLSDRKRIFSTIVSDTVEKTVTISNVPTNEYLDVILFIKYMAGATINFPNNIKWKNGTPPSYSVGYYYTIRLQSIDSLHWQGSYDGSWEVDREIVTDGLYFRLDASAITGLVDGDKVATWVDTGSAMKNATQSVEGAKPTYKTNILNGKPVVRFDGTDDTMVIASSTSSFNFLHNAQATVFIVSKPGVSSDPNARYVYLTNNRGLSQDPGIWIAFDDLTADARNNAAATYISATAEGQWVTYNIQQNVITPNTFGITTRRIDCTNETASERLALRINNGSDIKANTFANTVYSGGANYSMQLGST